jgi:hypothetical protein
MVNYPITRDASDLYLSSYAREIESSVPGTIGAEIRRRMAWYWAADPRRPHENPADRRASAAINAHAIATEIIGKQRVGSTFQVYLRGEDGGHVDIISALNGGSPVGIILNLTPSLHFITIIGYRYDDKGELVWVVHDPYGNFYPQWDAASLGRGENRLYPAQWMRKFSAAKSGCGYYWYWKR